MRGGRFVAEAARARSGHRHSIDLIMACFSGSTRYTESPGSLTLTTKYGWPYGDASSPSESSHIRSVQFPLGQANIYRRNQVVDVHENEHPFMRVAGCRTDTRNEANVGCGAKFRNGADLTAI